jgi:hypothetical protein
MIDGGLRKEFHERLATGFHWQAIETGGTGKGIPDSNFCSVGGGDRWIEFKKTEGWAVDLGPEQIGWHRARARYGGRTYVAVRRRHTGGPRKGAPVDELWLAHGGAAAQLKAEGLKELEDKPYFVGRWHGGPSAWDWDAIAKALVA